MRPTLEERFWLKVIKGPRSQCWIWTGATDGRKKYGCFNVGGRLLRAHRVSYFFAKGLIPAGKDCCHKCDNPRCVNPAHLFLGTRKENIRDMFQKGRNADVRGGRNPHSKLSEQDVISIRKLVAAGTHTMADLARTHSVDHECIRMIVHRIKWKHI